MLATIWMCTQEWSLIPSRLTAFTLATCHQALRPSSAFTRSRIARSLRLRCAGTLIRICAVASAGVRRASRSASSETGSSIRSRSSLSSCDLSSCDLSSCDTATRAYYDSRRAHDGQDPQLELLLGRGLRGDPRREVDRGACPRPLGGAAPLHRARALVFGNQPADALGAAARAGARGHRRPSQLPRVAASRRVRADREGRGAPADHRGDAPLRAHLARGRRACFGLEGREAPEELFRRLDSEWQVLGEQPLVRRVDVALRSGEAGDDRRYCPFDERGGGPQRAARAGEERAGGPRA